MTSKARSLVFIAGEGRLAMRCELLAVVCAIAVWWSVVLAIATLAPWYPPPLPPLFWPATRAR